MKGGPVSKKAGNL